MVPQHGGRLRGSCRYCSAPHNQRKPSRGDGLQRGANRCNPTPGTGHAPTRVRWCAVPHRRSLPARSHGPLVDIHTRIQSQPTEPPSFSPTAMLNVAQLLLQSVVSQHEAAASGYTTCTQAPTNHTPPHAPGPGDRPSKTCDAGEE